MKILLRKDGDGIHLSHPAPLLTPPHRVELEVSFSLSAKYMF